MTESLQARISPDGCQVAIRYATDAIVGAGNAVAAKDLC
jgi:hypothetical protein